MARTPTWRSQARAPRTRRRRPFTTSPKNEPPSAFRTRTLSFPLSIPAFPSNIRAHRLVVPEPIHQPVPATRRALTFARPKEAAPRAPHLRARQRGGGDAGGVEHHDPSATQMTGRASAGERRSRWRLLDRFGVRTGHGGRRHRGSEAAARRAAVRGGVAHASNPCRGFGRSDCPRPPARCRFPNARPISWRGASRPPPIRAMTALTPRRERIVPRATCAAVMAVVEARTLPQPPEAALYAVARCLLGSSPLRPASPGAAGRAAFAARAPPQPRRRYPRSGPSKETHVHRSRGTLPVADFQPTSARSGIRRRGGGRRATPLARRTRPPARLAAHRCASSACCAASSKTSAAVRTSSRRSSTAPRPAAARVASRCAHAGCASCGLAPMRRERRRWRIPRIMARA